MTNAPDRLALEGIVKRFGAFRANDDVNLKIADQSIHAILGENGAGKSTLMNVIYGLYTPDAGRILSRGKEVTIGDPREAMALGIGMVHQHFKQVNTMSVVENVVLGLPGRQILDLDEDRRRIETMAAELGSEIDPDQLMSTLPIGTQQRVEILKMLYREADLLILDEPTSVLTPNEIESFFKLLSRLRESGRTILLITHKLDEVMDLSDRVTVMRQGRVEAELETSATTPKELARVMVGRDVVFDVPHTPPKVGAPVLELDRISAVDDRGVSALDELSLSVREGEILGIVGIDGNGQRELAETVAGLRNLTSGKITVSGRDAEGYDPAERKHKLGVGYVPEDRQKVGLDLDSDVSLNMVLRGFRERPFAIRGWMDYARIRSHAEDLAKRYDVRMQGVSQIARDLSGGNQQKIILAREIEDNPRVLVVSQPTKGLDVGAIEFVQRTLLSQRDRGDAILYISSELEELLLVADRLAVIFKGRIVGELPASEATSEKLGLLMTGKEVA
ncbi:ABC transporter ATP-binding protein [Roseovarius sp. TE539]|uniref:ABC transporter ATP-binding protein n=1 Tax=Roseovarius sp. TE539 TaxID=2249812 RepID=UPI000DE154B7|nr:ABC transporter ATP-binding protein [Roseovarius sp. TE539]RBI69853.1 ABC transporter ATP-binding protein [Roseovarius sp. TE539]